MIFSATAPNLLGESPQTSSVWSLQDFFSFLKSRRCLDIGRCSNVPSFKGNVSRSASVERGSDTAKIWLTPVRLHDSHGFARTEIGSVLSLIGENRGLMLRRWNEFFHHGE